MKTRAVVVLLGFVVLAAAPVKRTDPLAEGIRLIEAGEFAAAVPLLEKAVKDLGTDPSRAAGRARALRYLGLAHLGRGYEALAAAGMADAAAFAPRPPARKPAAAAAEGSLQVVVQPWADIVVDGESVGETPFRRLPLAAGTHTVRVEHPAFEPIERQVKVEAGEVTRLVLDLEADGKRRPQLTR